jgi:hypothetical protein
VQRRRPDRGHDRRPGGVPAYQNPASVGVQVVSCRRAWFGLRGRDHSHTSPTPDTKRHQTPQRRCTPRMPENPIASTNRDQGRPTRSAGQHDRRNGPKVASDVVTDKSIRPVSRNAAVPRGAQLSITSTEPGRRRPSGPRDRTRMRRYGWFLAPRRAHDPVHGLGVRPSSATVRHPPRRPTIPSR